MQAIYNNFASGTLLNDILAGDFTLTLDTGEGQFFPSPIPGAEYCVLVIEDIGGLKEVIHLTERVGDVMTITRGEESTTPRGYLAGSRVELRATAGFFNEFMDSGTF
jgi:hypothetical protein